MSDKLLPCPFCGSSDIYNLPALQGDDHPVWFPAEVKCNQCGANVETVDEWNTRTEDPVKAELLEALKKCVLVLGGESMSKSSLIKALGDGMKAIAKATGGE